MTNLPQEPKAINGATLRRFRMIVLSKWLIEVRGAPIEKVRGFTTLKFGMRGRTTDELIKDMENARILKTNGVKFIVTSDGEKWLKEAAKE